MHTSNINIIPPIIAHRGASAYAPENTLPAFIRAKELGAKWIEFDVQLTNDDELILFHDESLDRTSNGKGMLYDFSLSDLQRLDFGKWFNPSYVNVGILTLEDALLFLQKENMGANIEVKAREGQEELLAEKIVSLIQNHLSKKPFNFFISSFNPILLQTIRKQSLDFPLAFLMDEWFSDWQLICDGLNCMSVNVNHQILSADKVNDIRRTNRLVMAYTVNENALARTLFSWGVNAIFTDMPDKILSSL